MMAIFNLRRVFLPTAVWSLRLLVAVRKSRFVLASTFTLFRFQPEDDPKRRPRRARRLATLLVAGVFVTSSTAQPVDAGLWDAVKEWYVSFQLGEVDEANISQVPVEYVGEIGLELQDTIDIPLDEKTPGIGKVRWIGITPQGTLLITDSTNGQAYEFSLHDGHYIRSFGRKGNGPGEYMFAENIAIDPEGQSYLLDGVDGVVLRYDRQGRYLDKTSFIRGCRVLTGRNGELFFLGVNPRKIMELQYRDPANWEVLYRTALSTEKQSFLSYRMGCFGELCYSAASHRLYYLGVNDYRVKEINAYTNEIRQFGLRPEGFISLPESYHNIDRGTPEDMQSLLREISFLKSMTLVQDRYLLISYSIALPSTISWVVYDLDSATGISSYIFNEEGKERLRSFGNNEIPIAAWRDRVYMWRAPSPETMETSNGTVEIYTLAFDTKLK